MDIQTYANYIVAALFKITTYPKTVNYFVY